MQTAGQWECRQQYGTMGTQRGRKEDKCNELDEGKEEERK